ncbi:MAG: nuclear transport factor 2 family protein [Pirellulales bacterium]
MPTTMPREVADYIRATNQHDGDGFVACFAEDALVNDAGREFRGAAAIKAWCDKEIVAAQVTLDVLDVAEHDRQVIVTTKVDGTYDKTGLPDPLILEHHAVVDGGKIARLTIRLPEAPTAS